MRVQHGKGPVNAADPISSGDPMTTGNEWQARVGESWAREWRRTDRSFGVLTTQLIEVAMASTYAFSLDIGCGAGELTVRLAQACPSSRHLGVDISEELLAVARERVRNLPNARVDMADAACWKADVPMKPDLLVSRHGVMFFENPVSAFTHLRGEAAPDARLVFSCFREREANAWATELASVLGQGPVSNNPREPGPFAFGDKEYVAQLLGEAGWRDVVFEQMDYPMIAGKGANAIADAVSYFRVIGPAARGLAQLNSAEREVAIERLAAMLEGHLRDDCVSLPASCWIVTAQANH